MTALAARGICKSFGCRQALTGADLESRRANWSPRSARMVPG